MSSVCRGTDRLGGKLMTEVDGGDDLLSEPWRRQADVGLPAPVRLEGARTWTWVTAESSIAAGSPVRGGVTVDRDT